MPAADASLHDPALAITTLLCWLFTASLGGYMLRSLIVRDGLRRQLTVRDGLHPGVLVGHFSLALTGLVTWICFLISAWLAVVLLVPGIGLGITTVTLWTPYPHSPSAAPPGQGSPGQAPSGPPLPGQTRQPGEAPPMLAPPAENAVSDRLTDAMLAQALTDEAQTRKLIDEMIASVAADAAEAKRKKPKRYPVAVIPFAHGLGALVTFALAVVTAAGMR
jgi:hypothetical protein